MSERIQVILEPEEKMRLQRHAEREGCSLSAWMRRVALERLAASEASGRFGTRSDLREFFARCAAIESGDEPDWDVQLRVIDESRRSGVANT